MLPYRPHIPTATNRTRYEKNLAIVAMRYVKYEQAIGFGPQKANTDSLR